MNANALAAAKAYLGAANPAAGAASTAGSVTGGAGGGFGDMVADAMNSVVQSGRETEAQVNAVATGNGNMVDVVTAVAETELALETMVTVRDRVISAYQEIMNMPI